MALVQRHFFFAPVCAERPRRTTADDVFIDSDVVPLQNEREMCVCVCSFLRVGKSSTEFAFHKFDE